MTSQTAGAGCGDNRITKREGKKGRIGGGEHERTPNEMFDFNCRKKGEREDDGATVKSKLWMSEGLGDFWVGLILGSIFNFSC